MSKSKQQIQYDELSEFIGEFKNESDRAAVILAAAKLDLLLYQLIQGVLLPSTSKTDELLDGDSPLGTFSSRIAIAHRLGLIDDGFCRALNLIRRIRNSFAHELRGAKLDAGAHRDRIRELVASVKDHAAFDWLMEHFFDSEPTPTQHFRCVVALACVRFDGACAANHAIPWKPQGIVPTDFKGPQEKEKGKKVLPASKARS